jgi:hypothetical protein
MRYSTNSSGGSGQRFFSLIDFSLFSAVIAGLIVRQASGNFRHRRADKQAELRPATKTIADFERGAREPYPRTLEDVRAALEQAGVEFIAENGGGAGVRLREAKR